MAAKRERRWALKRVQAAVEWTQCRRRGSSTGSSRIPTRGQAAARRSVPARGLPHVCEHKCLATTKRCRGSGEEGVEDLISDSGNDHNDGEASFSESYCLFTCSIDELELRKVN
jgi:hypothetical protein